MAIERGGEMGGAGEGIPEEGGPEEGDDFRPLSEKDWQERLSPEAFRVTRKKGTERAFSGEYWDEKRPGVYRCICCGMPLFSSRSKFDSGTGWPSFWDTVGEDHVGEREDRSFFMRRTEVVCTRCNAHLGHVFPDGPEPTGLRYCINSVALRFEEGAEEEVPADPPSISSG